MRFGLLVLLFFASVDFAEAPVSVIRFELQRLPVTLENHPTARKYLVETMAGGIAAFD